MPGRVEGIFMVLLGAWVTGFCLARWAGERWPGGGYIHRLQRIRHEGSFPPWARQPGARGRRPAWLHRWKKSLEERLEGAGWKLGSRKYLLVTAAIGVAGLLVGWLLTGKVYWGVVFGVGGAFCPALYLEKSSRARREMVGEQLEQVLFFITGSLRAGQSLVQALEGAVHEVQDPMAREIQRVMDEYHLGVSLSIALRGFKKRAGCSEVDYFVEAMEIYWTTGGNLGEILINLSDTIRERRLLRHEIRSKTAEGRLAASFVALTPLVLSLYLLSAHPSFLEPLLTHPVGRIGLTYAALSWLTGMVVTRKLVNRDDWL